jgi:DivIVA domain-containing protein
LALDRQSIARRDFPAARRGYDPAAVDRHLDAIAAEVDELRRRAATPGAALATQTSDQVRTIIEAAESSAAGIRESASADARGHVERVAEAADGLRERIDALERELTDLLGTLRAGAGRLRAELEGVAEGTARLAEAGGQPAGEPPSEPVPAALSATVAEAAAAAPEAADAEVGEEPAGADIEAAPARSTDFLGARIVAFEWAASGRPREETDRHLARHFDLDDREGMLDDVYARVPKT